MVNPKLTNEQAKADVKPITDWAATFPKELIVANDVFPTATFYEACESFKRYHLAVYSSCNVVTKYLVGPTGEAAPIGMPAAAGSRLLTDELWAPAKVNQTVK